MDLEQETIEEICDDIGQEQPKITLETFDPFNKAQSINSPRSLKICSKHGIFLQDLYHKSFDEIKRMILPQEYAI